MLQPSKSHWWIRLFFRSGDSIRGSRPPEGLAKTFGEPQPVFRGCPGSTTFPESACRNRMPSRIGPLLQAAPPPSAWAVTHSFCGSGKEAGPLSEALSSLSLWISMGHMELGSTFTAGETETLSEFRLAAAQETEDQPIRGAAGPLANSSRHKCQGKGLRLQPTPHLPFSSSTPPPGKSWHEDAA